jgi:predicted enzyme related to lactoylglutathione lyase
MPERDGYIPGVPCWVDTNQPDPAAAVPFYAGLFGWDLEDAMPEGSGGHYFMARIRGGDVAAISSIPDGAPSMAMWNTYIWVDDADLTAKKAVDAGGAVLSEPFDVMDAGRMAVLADPEGAMFCAWQPKQHRGARVVNEHGSLNFNGLACRDVAAAERFYGAVFGWKAVTIGGGQMWVLPGYGDHLEEATPGLRASMGEMGAPDGFIDVVAQITPIEGGADVHPHWSVTFATDDVAATAAKAKELGGQVLEGPVDAPWVRHARIQDPQGAQFVASQFVAENAVR